MNTNNGGSAFPHPQILCESTLTVSGPQAGMSLRDYYAAAITGLLSDRSSQYMGVHGQALLATTVFEIADAMLKARKA